MRPIRTFTQERISLIVMVGGALLILGAVSGRQLGALVGADDPDRGKTTTDVQHPGTAVLADEKDAPPPPPYELRYVDKNGYLRSPQWDDRHISEDQKLAEPVANPRWGPFARCMAAAGFEVRRSSPVSGYEPFLQQDLDSLAARLSAPGPLVVANEDGTWQVNNTAETTAYIQCAAATLDIPSEELATILTQEELAAARAAGLAK